MYGGYIFTTMPLYSLHGQHWKFSRFDQLVNDVKFWIGSPWSSTFFITKIRKRRMKKCFFSSYLFFLFCLFFILHFWFASLFQPKLKHLKGNNCQLEESLCTASHPCSCFCMICGWLRCWNIGKGTIVRHINLNLLP